MRSPGKSLLIGLALVIGFSLFPPGAATGDEKPAAGKTSSIYVGDNEGKSMQFMLQTGFYNFEDYYLAF